MMNHAWVFKEFAAHFKTELSPLLLLISQVGQKLYLGLGFKKILDIDIYAR